MQEKPLIWVGSALDDLKRFPVDVRRRAGFELDQVQHGESPTDWKPVASAGPGVLEIRIHTRTEHRVFYIARFPEAVYVLHACEKKSVKTLMRDLRIVRARLAEVLAARSNRGQS